MVKVILCLFSFSASAASKIKLLGNRVKRLKARGTPKLLITETLTSTIKEGTSCASSRNAWLQTRAVSHKLLKHIILDQAARLRFVPT